MVAHHPRILSERARETMPAMGFQQLNGLTVECAKGPCCWLLPDDLPPTPLVDSADGPALCERVRSLLDGSRARAVVCDVGALTDADLGTVDALTRLELTAQRLGGSVWLSHVSAELGELLVLAGLRDVVPCLTELAVDAIRQPEDGEEPRRVEEEGDPTDPTG